MTTKTQAEIAYRWLPVIGEWYKVIGEIFAFSKLGELKKYYKSLDDDGYRAKDNNTSFALAKGTWVLVVNITLDESKENKPTYLEFLIRRGDAQTEGTNLSSNQEIPESHAQQQLFFLPMFPPVSEEDNQDITWEPLLRHMRTPRSAG